jgi:hypothetical protein
VNFNFGNKKPDIKQYAIIGIVLTSIIALFSDCTGIKEDVIWDFVDEAQREIRPNTMINDFIIHDPERLNRRVKRDVDRALQSLTNSDERVILPSPRFIEYPMNDAKCYSSECRALGPPMRLCSSWWDECPDSSKIVTQDLTSH